MPEEGASQVKLRLTCPPCGHVFVADDEDALVQMTIEHARKFHDLNLLEQSSLEELRATVRKENESYWQLIGHLIPEGGIASVIETQLCEREREIVECIVHGFSNKDMAKRLCISERTVSTHLVNIYEKLNVHSRAELTALVRASDRIIEAGLRFTGERPVGPFIPLNLKGGSDARICRHERPGGSEAVD